MNDANLSDFPLLRHDGVDEERELSVFFQFEDRRVCIPRSLLRKYDEKYCRVARWKAEDVRIDDYEVIG